MLVAKLSAAASDLGTELTFEPGFTAAYSHGLTTKAVSVLTVTMGVSSPTTPTGVSVPTTTMGVSYL